MMKGNAIKCLQGMLWFVCAFHIVVGAGLVLIPGMASFMAKFYGAEVNWTPEFTYILKPLGGFMFALGLICISAALNPLKHRMVVYAFATLFVIRATQRLLFAQEIFDTFAIGTLHNIANMVFFYALAATLIVLEQLARSESAAPAAASE